MNLADLPVESNGATVVLRRYEIATRSDIGLVRQGNEDNFYVCGEDKDLAKRGVLVGVADGMGGHNAGEVASQVAVETLAMFYDQQEPGSDLEHALADMIRLANERIIQLSNSSMDLQGLGTTLTALLLRPNEAIVAHVGDCRIYLFRAGALSQITLDHSLVQEAVREGILTPEQARVHPQRNIITRALGTQDTLEVDSLTVKCQPGDIFLLSSDGLHGLLEDYEIEEIIANGGGELDQISQDLVQCALDEGGNDNVTVILVKVPAADEAGASKDSPAIPT